jgi:DNA-binding IclR family transcriptional regulator
MAVTRPPGAYFVTRTVRALELLAFGPLSAPQLAEAMQVGVATARRMLWRLAEEEYVVQLDEPRRRYALTPRLVAVAGQWLEHSELPRLAAPFVALLHARTSLTAHLVVPSYDRVVCLVHSNDAGVPEPRLRELVPAHCTAGGKALLAGRERWRRSLLSAPLRAYTERTVTDPGAVERETSATRERGYAIEDGEYRPGVRAVAAAVRDRAGNAIAAIGVSVAGDLDVETIGSDALRTAGELSTALVEYMPSQPARSPSR